MINRWENVYYIWGNIIRKLVIFNELLSIQEDF